MKQTIFKAVAVSTVLLLVAGVSCCVEAPIKQAKTPVPVKVAAVELNSAESGARYSATIIPRTEVELAFKVGGYVNALQQVRGVDGRMRDLQEGDRITVGAVLARVRQSDYQVKVKEAESQQTKPSGVDAAKHNTRKRSGRISKRW
jgi:multidrug efflux pump subunit AcrA (membrane-fusion protein)